MDKYIAIVGTNSDQSTNRKLLYFIRDYFKNEADIEIIEIKEFPMFNKPDDGNLPSIVKEVAQKIEEADGVIISTPEYNHAVPAALMNALNWLSYNIYPFVDKPVMITGASYGTLGSSRAQSHLKQMLDSPELKARTMPSSEFLLSHSLQAFDESGKLVDEDQIQKLHSLFLDFKHFVYMTNQLMSAHKQNKKEAENFSWENI
ncbi:MULTISPECIES: NADPH-dependent FMN reductase [Enterococcaceae]|uniref:NADPH-dependent FMN reductase n=1 Tax=Enterococcaceae TaxID=81852 RepID=UPI000E54B820|nr:MULTISPECIES: NADPH-dependent FMN reductase [Enterococcaceae]MCI0130265.1 NAD(P)H-dependent oxidoreductase [Vagococcus sp. CY53-2]RGI31122.1 NAD(P)H-dependent oxidoreductase [Melissococcus sp. OM08-11BH]UNM89085.1 NAD(P)H-dependent oxidoreductase [Vagococcus sp. CY52-2]